MKHDEAGIGLWLEVGILLQLLEIVASSQHQNRLRRVLARKLKELGGRVFVRFEFELLLMPEKGLPRQGGRPTPSARAETFPGSKLCGLVRPSGRGCTGTDRQTPQIRRMRARDVNDRPLGVQPG